MSTTKPPPLHRPIAAKDYPPLPAALVRGGLRFRIHAVISGMISDGRLRGGDYLPGELALAERWDVDRQTTRRGLQDLRDDGYIASAPGVGWYVCFPEDPESRFEVYASPDDPQVLRVVIADEFIWELDFRRLEHGSGVAEVPGDWRRMVILRD